MIVKVIDKVGACSPRTTQTAFDMRVQNDLDRFHLAWDWWTACRIFERKGVLSKADDAGQAHRAQTLSSISTARTCLNLATESGRLSN